VDIIFPDNLWNGGNYLFVQEGIQNTTPHFKIVPNPEIKFLGKNVPFFNEGFFNYMGCSYNSPKLLKKVSFGEL
jgi:hypothetical protein